MKPAVQRHRGFSDRCIVGKGAMTKSPTVERDLLRRADAYARGHGISRSKVVAQGRQAIPDSAA